MGQGGKARRKDRGAEGLRQGKLCFVSNCSGPATNGGQPLCLRNKHTNVSMRVHTRTHTPAMLGHNNCQAAGTAVCLPTQ